MDKFKMKKQKLLSATSSKLTKKTAALLLVILLVLATVATLKYYGVVDFFGSSKDVSGQAEGARASADKKKSLIENNASSNPTQKTSTSDNQKTDTPGTTYTTPDNPDNITLNAEQKSDSTITVASKLLGYSDGTCTLSISNGTKKYSQSADVIYQSQFSTCAGFGVAVSDLGTGKWSIDLKVVSHDITQTKSITFEVR